MAPPSFFGLAKDLALVGPVGGDRRQERVARAIGASLLALWVLWIPGCSRSPPQRVESPSTDERAEIEAEYERLVSGYDLETGARQLTPQELADLRASGRPVVILDVREPAEQAVSTLPGARRVRPAEVDELELDAPANAVIVTYCTAGYRSGVAAVALEERLGREVRNLHGGIIGWFNAGGEVVDARGEPVDEVHPYGPDWARFVLPRETEGPKGEAAP